MVRVFLDANVVIRTGRPPGGPIFARMVDLVKADFVSVITTDLTKTEIAKKHAENDYAVVKEVGRPHFRKIAHELLGIDLPDIKKSVIMESLLRKYEKETNKMFESLGAKVLPIDSIKPSAIFDEYARRTGFFSGEGKKDQFPDAFIFECVKAYASSESPVIIISDDGDFDGPSSKAEHISVLKSIPELFRMLGLEVEEPEVEEFLEENEAELMRLVDEALADSTLEAIDVDGAEIEEPTVTGVEVTELMSFGGAPRGGSILVVGKIDIQAEVGYSHPNWDTAMYDSEDGVLIPFEEVSGHTEITISAEFSMTIGIGENKEPKEIVEFIFRNDDFRWVTLHS